MKREIFLDVLGILGLFLASSGFIEGINPYIKYPSSILGVLGLGFYAKMYYDDKIQNVIKQTKQTKEENKTIHKKMVNITHQIERIKGWIECAQHFFPKNKKGRIDPITLITILIILIIIIVWIQQV